MISVIQNLFGAYTPLSGDGVASINWEWISGIVLFMIVLISVFRLIAIFFKRGK